MTTASFTILLPMLHPSCTRLRVYQNTVGNKHKHCIFFFSKNVRYFGDRTETTLGWAICAMYLIDIGATLAHDSFDPYRPAVLERAQIAGVHQIVITASDADS